jgi:hypothetical protein
MFVNFCQVNKKKIFCNFFFLKVDGFADAFCAARGLLWNFATFRRFRQREKEIKKGQIPKTD